MPSVVQMNTNRGHRIIIIINTNPSPSAYHHERNHHEHNHTWRRPTSVRPGAADPEKKVEKQTYLDTQHTSSQDKNNATHNLIVNDVLA